ncbi:hypothetical protein [Clostridium perfringens]|uniref:hypothetical protein n=1 Tax=Clostridium perfringens TaxID=1502 RepID=UPI00096A6099|nr:hypothetical protein [Clostridium perfringens]
MEERKITNIKLIEDGKVEVEITKTVKEKVILNQYQLLDLTSENQMKSSISSKDSIFKNVVNNYPKTTFDRCYERGMFGEDVTDKRLKVKVPEPFKVVVKMDKPLDEMELKDLSNQIKGSINNGNLGRKIK